MTAWNNDASNRSKIGLLRVEADEVKTQLIDNLQLVDERGAKLKLIKDKSEHLVQTSYTWKKNAIKEKRKSWLKKYWMYLLAVGLAVGCLFFLYLIAT